MDNERLETASEAAAAPADPAISAWPFMGYAPGNYSCKCVDCDETFQGEKRCLHCLECAVVAAKRTIANPPASPIAENEQGLKSFAIILESGIQKVFRAARLTREEDWIVLHNDNRQIAHFFRPLAAGEA